jgi:hypothetical protein
MATFNKFDTTSQNIGLGKHNLLTAAYTVALCAGAPTAGMTSLASLTEISYANLSARTIAATSFNTSLATAKLILPDLVLTASGAVATFRYVVLYNATATGFELLGWYDYAANVTLANLETFTIDFDAAAGVLTLT